MIQARTVARRKKVAAGLLISTVLLGGLGQGSSGAQVTTVTGSAFGYYVNVGLFNGPSMLRGFGQGDDAPATAESPSVTLPAAGSATPITDTDPDGATAQYGPAVIFDATSMEVSTQGTTGPDGSVTSTATVERDRDQEQQNDPYNADTTESTCTAAESGLSGSVTLTNASLVLRTDKDTQEPVETIPIPDNPAPNTEHTGTIDHVGDRYRVVFNEQVREGGTLTVNAVHVFLLGDVARGDFVIAQAVCGVNATGSGGGGDTSTTTQPGGATSTTQGGNTTTTTTRSGGSGGTSADPAVPTDGEPRFTG